MRKREIFDYKLWVEHAVLFTQNLSKHAPFFGKLDYEFSAKTRLSENELNIITSKTDKFIPNELKLLWLNGSRQCKCSYLCNEANAEMSIRIESIFAQKQSLYDGASFYDAAEIPEQILALREWAEETWISEYPEQKEMWLNSVPFAGTTNGDYLSLDITNRQDNPPVIYLSHDDESSTISKSFTDFLTHWENLCYIGPEIWILNIFQDDKGYINSNSERAKKLRNLFELT